nr:PREDICTED: uncharacterized protein LOC662514 [Tribolium castaneum]|eukprot:XP_015836193.1 PREDICTED: uncharacterized protein LOC662514 [Tribolium castaneum]
MQPDIDVTSALTWAISALALFFLVKYNWKRRWLYYHGSKIDGPFGWPIIGSAHYFIGGQKVFYQKMVKVFETQPSVFKFWLGKDLLVVTSKPEDVEIVLNNNSCFGKPKFYDFAFKLFRNGLLIAPASIWRDRRRVINPTFNPKILNSFIEIFGKHGNKLVKVLEESCSESDIFLKLFRCTFDIACETLADVDSELIKGQDKYLQTVIRMEDILAIRSFSIWLHPDFLWKRSFYGKEMEKASAEVFAFVKQILALKKASVTDDENYKKKRFLNHLLTTSETNPQIDELAILEEIQTILVTGSETTAITIGMVFIILGIYPEIQEKVRSELELILGPDDREITLEDINNLEYLERVIKETLRVLPIVPLITRTVEQDVKLGTKTIPSGSFVLVPIASIGKKAEFWAEPKKFDPDRFLPENNANRPRCSFIPFSYGPRNCIGFKYGMMSLKVLLATVIRKFTFKPSQYRRIEDVRLIYGMVAKPKHALWSVCNHSFTMKRDYIDITCALTWAFSALALVFIIKYNWSRRWLYYYGSKISGPFAWPIIGSAHHFIGGQKVFYKNMIKLFETQPPIFKFWLGKDLIVVTSRPEDVETVLSNCFGKPKFYDYSYKLFRDGLLIAPAKIWKDRRKIINPTFNPRILNSFLDIFNKHANRVVDVFAEGCGKESFDVFLKLFRCTLDIACETLADVDSDLIKGQDAYLQKAIRMEDVLAIRSFSVWLHPDIVWNNSSFGKEVAKASPEVFGFIKQIIGLKKLNPVPEVSEDFTIEDEFCKKKRFVNHLLTASETNPHFDELAVEEETQTILITGSETTAITIGMVLIILGIYPEIQEKIMDELDLVLGPDDRTITLEDINKMEYLERVIKETLRVLPIVPIILRSVDEDIKLDPYTIPAGSFVLVPIGHIGKKPEFWKEANKFDPDRFLPENNSNRHRCTFIPFSYGARNCVGFKYGMMSMKVLLAAILRKYNVKPAQYKSLEEIELIFGMVTKPKHGFKIKLEKKTKKSFCYTKNNSM